MTGEQPKPQAVPVVGLEKMAEGLLGRLVAGDIPEEEKADILVDLTAEIQGLRVLAIQQQIALVSMQNMLAIWNNCLLEWANDEKGRAFKAVMRDLTGKGLTAQVEPIELDKDIAKMLDELADEMDAGEDEGGESGEDEGGGEEGPVIDADFREVPSRKS